MLRGIHQGYTREVRVRAIRVNRRCDDSSNDDARCSSWPIERKSLIGAAAAAAVPVVISRQLCVSARNNCDHSIRRDSVPQSVRFCVPNVTQQFIH